MKDSKNLPNREEIKETQPQDLQPETMQGENPPAQTMPAQTGMQERMPQEKAPKENTDPALPGEIAEPEFFTEPEKSAEPGAFTEAANPAEPTDFTAEKSGSSETKTAEPKTERENAASALPEHVLSEHALPENPLPEYSAPGSTAGAARKNTQGEIPGGTVPQGAAAQSRNGQSFSGMVSEPDAEGIRYYRVPGNSAAGGTGTAAQGKTNPSPGKRPVLIFAGILLALIVFGLLGRAAGFFDSEPAGGSADESGIAIVHLRGVFGDTESSISADDSYNHRWILDTLDSLIENPDNEGMVLYIDSPGGAVFQIDQVYRKLCAYRETGRPIYACVGSMAASGGYYTAAPADKIIADRNSIVGSIGVMTGPIYDISELLEKCGIKSTLIVSGKNKGMGDMSRPLTREQKAIYQRINDEYYDNFVRIVAEGRNMTEQKVRRLGDGRIYTAKQAVENGLIDEIGTLEETILQMKSECDLEDCETYDLKYINHSFFDRFWAKISRTVQSARSQSDLSAAMELAENRNAYPVYYLMH